MSRGLVYTIVLNYNTWQFTQLCIDSLLKSDYSDQHIIVIDNASSNDSVIQLKAFFESLDDQPEQSNKAFHLTSLYRIGAISITFIESLINGGYAAGNNIGLRWAMADPKMTYFWILNNDTIIAPDSLSALVDYDTNPLHTRYGLIGSLLMYHDKPEVVQAIGGNYNRWLGISHGVGQGETNLNQLPSLIGKIDYIIGAACFGRRTYLEQVGYMTEDYFLYSEDNDWSIRGQRQNLPVGVCLSSRVYHRDGGSTRKQHHQVHTPLVEYYDVRNRIRFSKRFFPHYVPLVFLSAIAIIIIRVLFRNPTLAWKLVLVAWQETLYESPVFSSNPDFQ